MSLSFWEHDNYTNNSYLILGGGITGVSTAISIKEKSPDQEVVICDSHFPPMGASTKNAGFFCFGSPGELLADSAITSSEECIRLIRMRWEGAMMLKERLARYGVLPEICGGYELYDTPIFEADLIRANRLMYEALGIENYFERVTQSHFDGFSRDAIFTGYEGRLNPQMMMDILYKTAQALGVKFIFGRKVEKIDVSSKSIVFTDCTKLKFNKLAICTNGFAAQFLPQKDVHPARNTVFVTEAITGLEWDGVYHYDRGYFYFRRVGNRILVGGARNLEAEEEMTSSFGINPKIRKHLTHFLYERILAGKAKPKIDYWWSGILGVGKDKFPILEEWDEDCFSAVRLGGMGVAIGCLLGDKLAEMMVR